MKASPAVLPDELLPDELPLEPPLCEPDEVFATAFDPPLLLVPVAAFAIAYLLE